MNPIHLDTLLTIIDEGSFENASLALSISPSAVSQRIKALEKSVGRVLVSRTQPAVATEAGEVLVQAARKMALLQAETREQLAERLDEIPLTVAINADSLSTWFPPVFAEVAHWGAVTLTLRVEDEAHTLSLLRRGSVLGAVTREADPVAGCEVLRLGVMRHLPVATPELRARYTVDGQPDWVRMPVLRFGPNDVLQDRDLEGRVDGAVARRRVSVVPSAEGFGEAVRLGLGWGLLPEAQAAPMLAAGDVVQLDEKVVDTPLYWQRWRLESRLLARLTDAVVDAARAGLRT
ncbi:transcriptional regulator, ArgP family [Corynebacterium efficiens YS-314]|uniref:Lysine export transcriptional regulatory protein LysG n=1 Tax=Corynebacterium efficiens (strain DSM 44549 / YS-314 / AJ 12310 / JCM 11189 / NBRC 100395) TaxID=196164 RepID=LYSG_COREF|nr:LysR family transcriptional regulator ArgP [Corynebacterium efficiens]Q8RQM5.1 RecName: Full=Lysine export transcriptional regulatory protein LysG [Corynebacterium efficiens YS-314]EEW50642.1 transcriptional regulator, ArgP family [Corynebacterium efficiens YS-314]BAB88826.1 Lysine export transcriptional regulatory protein [Corynebacterium efficiens]BAC18168.1 lysine export regulator protein [Corynebacterium efficiens YS-314]